MMENILDAFFVPNEKLTALDISKRLSLPPPEVVSDLLKLEGDKKVFQLNGYWSITVNNNIEYKPTVNLSKHLLSLICKWGELSLAEICYMLNTKELTALRQLREMERKGRIKRKTVDSIIFFSCSDEFKKSSHFG